MKRLVCVALVFSIMAVGTIAVTMDTAHAKGSKSCIFIAGKCL